MAFNPGRRLGFFYSKNNRFPAAGAEPILHPPRAFRPFLPHGSISAQFPLQYQNTLLDWPQLVLMGLQIPPPPPADVPQTPLLFLIRSCRVALFTLPTSQNHLFNPSTTSAVQGEGRGMRITPSATTPGLRSNGHRSNLK